ncbi:MAG: SMP-30/gluconolactonase/LRE family protein [Ignavibacteriae bacterium]|nr:SMP-30/gluconolactonase/LRE family protein [Ignavibacteriota bacterium]
MNRFFLLIFFLITISIFPQDNIEFSDWELVADNQKFPEGITYDNNGNLYSSNCYGNWITRISGSKIDTFLLASDSTFKNTNGMIARPNGTLIAADFGNGVILNFSGNGKTEILIDGYNGSKFNKPNDLTLDENGNLYFTDPKTWGHEIFDGRVFYYNFSTKTVLLVQDSIAFPNGIGISPKTERLYLSESAKSRILSFRINSDGSLDDKKVFVEIPGGDPDGFNFDEDGNLYAAHFGGGNIYVISPEGKILKKIKTPGKKPSNVEFADEDLMTLYITEDETNSIYKCRVNKKGFNLFSK